MYEKLERGMWYENFSTDSVAVLYILSSCTEDTARLDIKQPAESSLEADTEAEETADPETAQEPEEAEPPADTQTEPPETKSPTKGVEYYGQEASDYTKSSLMNKEVYLQKDVSESNRVYFNTREEALNVGYVRCKVCNP